MLAFLMVAWSFLVGDPIDSVRYQPTFQLSGAFGVCERIDREIGSPTGFSFGVFLKKLQLRSAHQVRFLYHEEFIILTDPVERYIDFSYLYHLVYPYRLGHVSAGAGVGFVSGTLQTKTQLPHPSGFGSTYRSNSLSSIGLAGGLEATLLFNNQIGAGLLFNTFWCEKAQINSGLASIILLL